MTTSSEAGPLPTNCLCFCRPYATKLRSADRPCELQEGLRKLWIRSLSNPALEGRSLLGISVQRAFWVDGIDEIVQDNEDSLTAEAWGSRE